MLALGEKSNPFEKPWEIVYNTCFACLPTGYRRMGLVLDLKATPGTFITKHFCGLLKIIVMKLVIYICILFVKICWPIAMLYINSVDFKHMHAHIYTCIFF